MKCVPAQPHDESRQQPCPSCSKLQDPIATNFFAIKRSVFGETVSKKGLCVQDEMSQPIGPPRVWLSDAWMPGLAMSRSLGDTLAATCGVTCCPDVSVVHITSADVLAIWASDGVWEFISSQEAVSAVADCPDAAAAAQLLVALAQEQWATNEADVSDDISCAVVFFSGHAGEGACAATGVAADAEAAASGSGAAADAHASAVGDAVDGAEKLPVPGTPETTMPVDGAGGMQDEFGIQGTA